MFGIRRILSKSRVLIGQQYQNVHFIIVLIFLNQYKVLVSDKIEDICIKTLMDNDVEVDARENVPSDELIDIIKNYDGLIVRSGTTVTKEVLQASDRLKVIGRAGTGVDNIDLDTATRLGKIVMNTPGGNTTSAAELTISLLMSLCRVYLMLLLH